MEQVAKTTKAAFLEMIPFILMAILITGVFYVNFGTVLIDGHSMHSTFKDGDTAPFIKTYYFFSKGDYNDFVVFSPVPGYPSLFTKRLIGMPGDTIEIKSNKVYRNGEMIEEPYIHEPMVTEDMAEIKLSDTQYFFMGDNRNYSTDCRHFGPIEKSLLAGKIIKLKK